NRRHVLNMGNLVTTGVQRPNGRLATRTRAFHPHFQILQAIILGGVSGVFGSHLGRERGALARATETRATRGRPGQRVALTISDGNDGVIERSVYVSDAIRNGPRYLLPTCATVSFRFSHDAYPNSGLTCGSVSAGPYGCGRWFWCADRAAASRDDDGCHGSSPDPSTA